MEGTVSEMAKIAFIMLTHKDPKGLIEQARRLTEQGDFVAIHYDARAKASDYALLQDELGSNPRVTFARRRHKCGWGEWSLVAASLEAVRAAVEAFPEATHFYMLSGDCMQIKTAEFAHAFLDADPVDYIECFDFFGSDWIKTGFKEERLIYRHFFNERTQKRLFYTSYNLQKRFGFTREVPADIEMKIGSQWWCLRRATIEKVLAFCDARPDVMRFFRTTWIPDETFFQTIVPHVVPEPEIRSRTLTFLMFTDYGMPVTFYNDHYDLLLSQNSLFARKVSADASELKQRLGALWGQKGVQFSISNEGRSLFKFLTGRGRIGRRFSPRFWEVDTSLGRENTLLIVVCKKWHVAKRLVAQVRQRTGIEAVEYLFNETGGLPYLGGIEGTLEKRHRHRRALVKMLFDLHRTDKLLICIDPSDFDLLQDFCADKARVRVLEIACDFSDDYLVGHARRVGLAGESTPQEVIDRLLPTIRADMRFESDRMHDADLPGFGEIREAAPAEENARLLAAFLGCDRATARDIAGTYHLFVD